MARKAGKATGRHSAQGVRKVKKTISLDVETARKLGAFAGHVGATESKVVADALKIHLEGFRSFLVDVPGDGATGRPLRLADPAAGPERESA